MVDSNTKDFEKRLKVSLLSKCAFLILIAADGFAISGWVFRESNPLIGGTAPFVLLGSIVLTSILSMIDVVKKNRRKWLSITMLVLNGIYILLFAALMIIFAINGAGSL